LDCGWIQVYVEDAQESLDMALQSYYIAEHENVLTPVMVNLDGFILTHTYESVEIPSQEQADEFLPSLQTNNKMDLDHPKNLAFSVGPTDNMEFKLIQHRGVIAAKEVIEEVDKRFHGIFHRKYGGLIDTYLCEDADYILLTLGSITGLCRNVVDQLRNEGKKVGVLKIRYLRPFPDIEIANAVKHAKAIGTLEKDISFGYEGTVYTNVNSALMKHQAYIPSYNFIGGLGGRDITEDNIKDIFKHLQQGGETINFIGLGVEIDG
jgi:pyruvate ferredoxin oxidoreductase alpha subunit